MYADARASRRLRTADQVEELRARARVLTERAEHAGGDELAARLLHSAHLHAEMPSLNDYTDTPGRESVVQRLRDLCGHALLKLQPVCESPDEARDLAQPDHLSLGQIPDMAAAEERQHVVLAQAVERNVLDEHHLVVVLVEHRARDDVSRGDVVAVRELSKRPRDSAGGPLQSLP